MLVLIALSTHACGTQEGPYPSRPIDIVTHASPGGGTDATARTMLIGARRALDTDMAVLFKGGGGGVVAMNYVASRPRDGHTVLAITPTHLLAMARGQGSIGIDDLIGLVRATDDPLVVAARAGAGLATLQDLFALGRQRPVKWGTGLIGGGDHLAAVLLARSANMELNVVPFAGGGEVATQLIGGIIDAAGLNITESLDYFERGTLTPLAVMAEHRLSVIPDVPTTLELGVDVVYTTVRGYAVLAGTPEDRIERLERGLMAGLEDPAFRRYLRGVGLSEASVAGREVWDAQMRRLYEDARRTLVEVGMDMP
jgi:putative tricarboxylic transport membrane protein